MVVRDQLKVRINGLHYDFMSHSTHFIDIDDEETVAEEPPIVKRDILRTVKGQKPIVSSFSMSLRSRKSLQ